VLAHLDTVHPIGMIEKDLKIRREGDSIFGPGIYDMKAGGYIAYYALRHLVRQGKKTRLPVTFLFIPEEEVGSPTSRARIEEAARGHKYALVMEPGRDGDRVVTSRKGVGRFTLTVKGTASHAGVRHQDGRSAIHEMAKQIMRIEAKTDYDRGITCNVGLIQGGTGVNVVPSECKIDVDLRVPSQQLAEEMTHWFLNLEPIGKDVTLTVEGEMNRPPYQKDAGISALFEKAQAIYREIGKELLDVPLTGGGSDGNFTAALGIPTLDGLGADGKGAHAAFEQIYYSSLVPRTYLCTRLLETLD
jgi:glutamate carboxypeptidase